MPRPLHIPTACLLASLAASPADAGFIHTPQGLEVGDAFRVMFVTSGTINGTSSALNTYGQFVRQAAAAAGINEYDGQPVTWTPVVSSPFFDAKSLIDDSDAPIFRMDGAKIVDNYADMLVEGPIPAPGTNLLENPINIDENNVGGINDSVWTGSEPSGMKLPFTEGNAKTSNLDISSLGDLNAGAGVVGLSGSTEISWLIQLFDDYNSENRVYAISDELIVPVPEPVSAGLFAGLMALLTRRHRSAAPRA